MTTGLSCRDLSVHADGHELVHVAALHVPAGRTLAVLGPNGAGKSTLLRALGLLGHHRTTGEILLDGRPVTRRQMRASVAAVLQRPILRRGTVGANVASGLRFRGVGRRDAAERAQPWLDVLGIGHLATRDARTLSGGEAQRVSIARALAVRPRGPAGRRTPHRPRPHHPRRPARRPPRRARPARRRHRPGHPRPDRGARPGARHRPAHRRAHPPPRAHPAGARRAPRRRHRPSARLHQPAATRAHRPAATQPTSPEDR